MTNSEKHERLFDTVQLAREIFVHAVVLSDPDLVTVREVATASFRGAEIFIEEQEKYAKAQD